MHFVIVVGGLPKKYDLSFQVIGPIIVDTTAPVFTGEITVGVEDDHLTARWTDGEFLDSSDMNLLYHIAFGKLKN